MSARSCTRKRSTDARNSNHGRATVPSALRKATSGLGIGTRAIVSLSLSLLLSRLGALHAAEKTDVDRIGHVEPPAPPLRAGEPGVEQRQPRLGLALRAEPAQHRIAPVNAAVV